MTTTIGTNLNTQPLPNYTAAAANVGAAVNAGAAAVNAGGQVANAGAQAGVQMAQDNLTLTGEQAQDALLTPEQKAAKAKELFESSLQGSEKATGYAAWAGVINRMLAQGKSAAGAASIAEGCKISTQAIVQSFMDKCLEEG